MVRTILSQSFGQRGKRKFDEYADVRIIPDIPYLADQKGSDYCLDLYMPLQECGKLPVIIDIHGGGLVYGTKELNRGTSAEMARRGYLVVALNYPLIPKVTLFEQVQILRKAFQFIETLALNYPMDLNRVYLKGDSAGGLLSILLCEDHSKDNTISSFKIDRASFTIKALALVHSLVDTKRTDILDFISKYNMPLNQPDCCDPGVYERPENLIPSLPPVWMVTSKNDFMFYNESIRFAEQLRSNNKRHRIHSFNYTLKKPLHHVFMITHPKLEESQMLYDSLHQFLQAVEEDFFSGNSATLK